MCLKILWISAFTAALMMLPGCGGSTASSSSPPGAAASSSPTADQVAAYRSLASRIDGMLRVHGFVTYCQPVKPNTTSQCRASVVTLIGADTDAIALLDRTTPPARYATQHGTLRAALVKDLALANQALSAIDSGKDAQMALDTFGPNFSNTIAPVLNEIQA